MKYFTLDWWNGIQQFKEQEDPLDLYEKYFQSIKSDLPKDLIDLHENISLHDSWVKKLLLDTENKQLTLDLDGDDGNGNLREINLRYENVKSFLSISDAEKALQGPQGYGDLGYDEIEILNDELYEHRILFSSGIELRIKFVKLHLSYMDHTR